MSDSEEAAQPPAARPTGPRSTTARPGKRERLIRSATEIAHSHGVQGTTLALVAKAADVPLGNVYYYFKTRDDLLRAVVDEHARRVDDLLASLDRRSTPRSRLKGLARNWAEAADLVAAHGCPIGGLSADLGKLDGGLRACAARLLRTLIDWAAGQLTELGVPDAPAEAVSLLARVQGAALLTNAFDDPKLLTEEITRIERAIDQLADAAQAAP
ncbi:TetR/AcrR family transcriptional regulator [Frankia sp. CNm7]|uniref:TetR/AcrR family transcriptional regulator n=1 Tax=Frankia nepalensis TaxID=1836974 RepID=A0A937RD07_9ACTN|nr:TetR/AcrR family transcriptional regulator [Frankia nepalensis]MBL7496797.1 TetR/AcrR family transcriptional regulator [Frankia nepalensis]MBL7511550.1 TetR/AcrR family transcriptional regulator [Frankia nepalensis]MBL7521355.1 TetR/AcrR family transcriptional regulator [Frankia nepalensis]MBL7626644.1 TetR/AcrR family transcriptional regulator [Frankia nepalensis]